MTFTFIAIIVQTPVLYVEIAKVTLNLICECRKSRVDKTFLGNYKLEELYYLILRFTIKLRNSVWYWPEDRQNQRAK